MYYDIIVITAVTVMTTYLSLCSYHFRNGRLDVVKYMVTKTNSDVNLKTKNGRTPLELAGG